LFFCVLLRGKLTVSSSLVLDIPDADQNSDWAEAAKR